MRDTNVLGYLDKRWNQINRITDYDQRLKAKIEHLRKLALVLDHIKEALEKKDENQLIKPEDQKDEEIPF